jgi:thiamine-phosphate pyrophosphorylase
VTFPPAAPSLYLCTPIREDLAAFITACVAGGVSVVQLRDKVHDDAALLAAAETLAATCRELGVPFLVNDRCDVARLVGADGVHVGQDDLPVARCRELLGDDAIIGLSTHDAAQLAAGLRTSATYLSAGPVAATPTKPGRPGTGPAYVADAVARSDRAVYVTGGVSVDTAPALAALGVRHFVVVRALTEARDPEAAARALHGSILEAVGATAS